MATLPDPRTQVLPDGAAFRVALSQTPVPSRRFAPPRRPRFIFCPLWRPVWDERPDGEAVMNEPTSPSVVHEDRNPLHTSPSHRDSGGGGSRLRQSATADYIVLVNGERLETRRFVLTASNLSFNIDRQQHTIPLEMSTLARRFCQSRPWN